MLVKVQLTTSEGETPPELYKVSITAVDRDGHPTGPEDILEIGSKAGTGKDSMQVTLPSASDGGGMLVKEHFPEPVYDVDQKATVPGEWPEPEPPEGRAEGAKSPKGAAVPPPPKAPSGHQEGSGLRK